MSFGLGIHLCLWSSGASQSPSPTLAGRWQIEFSLGSAHHSIQFDSQASGKGTFLVLDQRSSTPPATPTKASWSLRGQSPAIYYFVITGAVEFPTSGGGTEEGILELSASSDLILPITSLRGWGQFHSSSKPNDGRGARDPTFDFTARRLDCLPVKVIATDTNATVAEGFSARRPSIKYLSQRILTQQTRFLKSKEKRESAILTAQSRPKSFNFLEGGLARIATE
jgi:hypothetical protein